MTTAEWFKKYFATEYLNVQHPESWRAEAKEDLKQIFNLTDEDFIVPEPVPEDVVEVVTDGGTIG